MADRYPMTERGHKALVEELNQLKTVERPKIIDEIEKARAHGDLRENSEYHAAKEKYGFIQGRMDEISTKLSQSQIVITAELSGEKVVFGATVVLEDMDTGEKTTYQLVGEDEADIKEQRINYQSPIAKSLIGKLQGDEVTVKTPKGPRTFEILKVEFK